MRKRLIVVICLALAGTWALIEFLPQSPLLRDYSGTRGSFNLSGTDEFTGENGYLASFPLEQTPRGTINCYMLKYRPSEYDTAKKSAGMFIGVDSFQEDDESYIFSGKQGTITIDKDISQIHFDAAPNDEKAEMLSSDEDAIKAAADFIEKRLLALVYEEAEVHYDGDTYRVKFINRIGNLKNYAFTNQVTMDNYGRLISMDYYTIQYNKIGECQIKSMRDAFEELPALEPDETVLLSSCQLVYIYEDSIIQPAYYFQGSASDDSSFQCFVKAAVY